MLTPEDEAFIERAEKLYQNQWREQLERDHLHKFVAIEPESGEYFLGATLGEASQAARKSYPDRLTHLMRVGHRTALHLGVMIR